jgi:hypothetical protein
VVRFLLFHIFIYCRRAIITHSWWVPHGVEVERWLCNPRVSGSNPGAGNLEKVVYLDENSWTHTKS